LLAKTANPDYIFIDDYSGEDVRNACSDFVEKHIEIEWMYEIRYNTRGLLLKIKK